VLPSCVIELLQPRLPVFHPNSERPQPLFSSWNVERSTLNPSLTGFSSVDDQLATPKLGYPLSFDTLAHSLAFCGKLSPVFSSKSTLFAQNTRGGVPSICRQSSFRFNLRRLSARTGVTSRLSSPSLTLVFATLAGISQLLEISTTLSPVFATLTHSVTSKFFVCHSYKKPPGRGHPVQPLPAARSGKRDSLRAVPALFCTFLQSAKSDPLSFQPLPCSLCKTPGVGSHRSSHSYVVTSLTHCFCLFATLLRRNRPLHE
jgi:hypothetical protein